LTYAIKVAIPDWRARTFEFRSQKTMYGGKAVAPGDVIFLFASENEGGPGLVAKGCRDIGKVNSHAPEHVDEVTPKAISVLDHSKGFAHTDLVTC
jgi:hypothetical protein